MAIKKRDNIIDKKKAIENLADELADRPYGMKEEDKDELVRTTITLSKSLLFKLEDLAKSNRRKKEELKSVSAIIRYCVDKSLNL